MTPAEIESQLRKNEQHLAHSKSRLIPASFNPSESDMSACPIPADLGWDSCKNHFKHFNIVGVMMRLPLFWQMETPLQSAAREAGAFIFVNDRANMPLGQTALDIANIGAIVTDYPDALTFSAYLNEHNKPGPALWVIIHSLENALLPLPGTIPGKSIAREVHIFPGLPMLVQCPNLIDKKTSDFHIAPLFWHDAARGSHVLSTRAGLPFSTVTLPFTITETDICPCGMRVLKIS